MHVGEGLHDNQTGQWYMRRLVRLKHTSQGEYERTFVADRYQGYMELF